MTPFRHVLTMVAIAVAGAVALAAADPTAAEVAQALQKKIETIHDFTSDFVHVYEGGVLKKQVTERGRLLVKKPGKMRWEYSAPESKTFVSDGVRLYSYVPADKQVLVSPVPAEDEATTASLFLAGKGSLTRDFAASFVELQIGRASCRER